MDVPSPHQPAEPQRDRRTAPSDAAAKLLPEVYDELRRLAVMYLNRERRDHTLQPTALVHEAYLKLAEQDGGQWNDPLHFRAVAANAMRQILVDHARRRGADKRGGDWVRVTFSEAVSGDAGPDVDVLALHEALEALEILDHRKSRVVELRFFGGLTCEEAARALSIAPKTAEADWYMARAWLRQQLNRAT